jgi:glyoxylase-like metal-dependent hydrolase (beta-lactamase superfamily II)
MSWIDPDFPKRATPSDRVGRVLGLNPGMMTGPGTNTYLVGHRDPILIDTGAGVPGYMGVLEEYLGERGWRSPSRVILTHRHVDHLGGVPQLRERFPGLPVAKMIHKDGGLPENTADLRDGQVVEGDGVTLMPVHTPGHASDHLCYFLEEERALFSGDLILNGSTSVIPDEDGDLADYMASLRRVQALGPRRIYPAHGAVIENAAEKIQEYIDHRMERERQILHVLGNGARTIPEMVKIIYADVPEKLHVMAGKSVHSHLKKLVKDGRVTESKIAGSPSRWTLL